MADEFTIMARVYAALGSYTVNIERSVTDDLSLEGDAPGIVEIGTSEENIDFGDIAVPGWCYLQNLDDTNYVDIGPDSTGMVEMIRLYPGMPALVFLFPSVTLVGKANTAACRVLIRAFNNGTMT